MDFWPIMNFVLSIINLQRILSVDTQNRQSYVKIRAKIYS
jgi:hypothetical protein